MKLYLFYVVGAMTALVMPDALAHDQNVDRGVMAISVEESQASVVFNKLEAFSHPNESPRFDKTLLSSLKEAWLNYYPALLRGHSPVIQRYASEPVSPVFSFSEPKNGTITFVAISKSGRAFTVIVRIVIDETPEHSVTIYDVHRWLRNQDGKWHMSSVFRP